MRVIGFGEIINGKLKLRNQDLFASELATMKGPVEVVVQKQRSRRSLNQNAYYWGVVVKILSDELGYAPEEVHELLKQKFNWKDVALTNYLDDVSEEIRIGASTADLSKIDFMAYIDKIQRWAAEFLNVVIPDPNEDYQDEAERIKEVGEQG
jgi:hypothetical protein